MVFWPFFGPKISFLQFYPGKLSPIVPKPLLIDSTVKNTSSEVYLGSLAYRAENARKAFYYIIASTVGLDHRTRISINGVHVC